MRVFLLEVLGGLDPTGAAVEVAVEVLETSGTADEWAIAMRNLGRAGVGEERLMAASEAMLENEEWRAAPSAGYLEAFDVIVHTGNTRLVPRLFENCGEGGNAAVRHASYLTLFRLVQRAPVEVLGQLVEIGRGREVEAMVAGLVAGADVRDGAQRAIVERYLLDERRGVGELGHFCELFPSANEMVSNNLLTGNRTVDGVDLAEADAEALVVVESWLGDGRLERLHPSLMATRRRLERFVKR